MLAAASFALRPTLTLCDRVGSLSFAVQGCARPHICATFLAAAYAKLGEEKKSGVYEAHARRLIDALQREFACCLPARAWLVGCCLLRLALAALGVWHAAAFIRA